MSEKLTVALSADIKDLKQSLDKANGLLENFSGKTNNTSNKVKKDFSAMGTFASNAAGVIAGAFTVGAISQFGKAVIDTTAEFQKFEAVLSNTLGSSSAAQSAMQKISNFAAKTPFQVNELTGAFVKLANQGFTPTEKEMRKLGDLASSTGKSFDQLVEAILDAQVSEYERLKEFGVRANDMGTKVQFTFKGVKTVVDKTADSIRNYILSLGDLEGVSGSMAKISNTLGGRLSNLSDGFTQLQKNIGELNSGALYSMVSLLSQAVDYFNVLTKTKLQEQKLGIGVTIDREESDRIIKEFNQELARIGDIKDISKLKEHLEYLNTNLQFFQQAMVKETDTHARDIQFAYFNLYKEARKAANGQMAMLQAEMAKANQKLAEEAAKAAKVSNFKKTISFDNTINKINPEAEVDLTAIQQANKEINAFQANTNLLATGLNGIAVIGQDAFNTIKDNIVVSTDVTKQKLTELQEVGLMVSNSFATGIGNAFASAIIDGENFGDAMGKVLQQLGRDIIAQIVKLLALKAIMQVFGAALGMPALGAVASTVTSGLVGGRVATGVNTGAGMGGVIELQIKGSDLHGALQNYNNRLTRVL